MKKSIFICALILTRLSIFGQSKNAEKYFAKGYSLIDQKNYPAAIDSFLKAIEADSTGACGTGMKGKAHGELGYAYLKNNDTTNAEKYFDKSILLDSANPFPIQNRAVIFTMQNKYAEAFVLLNKLIKLRPNFIEAYIQRGFLYNADNKKDLAVVDFKKALQLNSKKNTLPKTLVNDLKNLIKGQ